MGSLVASFSGAANAQSIPLEIQRESMRIEEREIERRDALERRLAESQSPIRDHTPIALEEDRAEAGFGCARIREVRLVGLSLFNAKMFELEIKAATGDCVGLTAIRQVERAITNAYLKRGFITSRAFAAKAPDAFDVLIVRIVEGRIDALTSGAPVSNRSGKAYGRGALLSALGNMEGKRLNLRALEQGVDHLARLPSGIPTIDIKPSSEPGNSDLVVTRERTARRLRPSLTMTNGGSRSTGKEVLTLGIEADDLIGRADFLSLYLQHDIATGAQRQSQGGGAFFSIPSGRFLFSVSGNYSEHDSILTSNDLQFSNTGRSYSGSASIDGLIFRNAKSKFFVTAQISVLDTETKIQDIRLSVNSYRLVTLTARGRLQSRLGRVRVSADLGYIRGVRILGASAADFGPTGPSLEADKVEAGLSVQLPIQVGPLRFSAATSIRGQYALDPLLAAERISIGGEQSVRGYRDDGASGDHGAIARSQVAIPLFTAFRERAPNSGVRFSASIGHDAGWVWDRASGNRATFLQSAHAGLSLSNARLNGQVVFAKPLSSLFGVAPRRPEILASLTVSI